MAGFRHGARVTEKDMSSNTPIEATTALPLVIGKAPIHLATKPVKANDVIACYSWEDFVTKFGYSDDWEKYTLCEYAYAAFNLFNVAPIVFSNVLDATEHIEKTTKNLKVEALQTVIEEAVLLETLILKDGEKQLENDIDYIASYKGDVLKITLLDDKSKVTELHATYTKLTADAVTDIEIIGGYDAIKGINTGIEVINNVFPQLGMTPGLLMVPGYAQKPEIAAIMRAKSAIVNNFFRASTVTDIDTVKAPTYDSARNFKQENGYVGTNEYVGWPLFENGDKRYHASTIGSLRIVLNAAENNGYTEKSPSNKSIPITKMVDHAGEKIVFGPEKAEVLNEVGIFTGLYFGGRWVLWGNGTAAHLSANDVKDRFIANRVTHNWIANTVVLTTWLKVDDTITPPMVSSVADSLNIWLNLLQSMSVILGGRIVVRQIDNPPENLMAGKLVYRLFTATPTPAQDIETIIEVDKNYYNITAV